MIIGIGKSPLADFINRNFRCESVYAYPKFFDNKVLLLENRDRAYIHYIKLLIRNIGKVRIALWPDYTNLSRVEKVVNLGLLKGISFIVPIHTLEDIKIAEELYEHDFKVFYGYASDPKYRNYEIIDFIREVKGRKWYLGVSTRKELKEAIRYDFDGFDVTGFLFGRNEDRKDPRALKRNLEELLKTVSKPQGRQLTLFDFLEKPTLNSPV
ncbi:hypothetical protein [Saccharolobus islandicus]|uniref:Uncharacterized protein n=1 Tax=Saccharolobus islandicus (strain M.16.27) TaxID=427318 RepID=C3N5X7_SACI3|nr:hypothetical protein [Sulfolobus islandicus]ACP55402.1 conserved hypothetical protein [Sulfolobus islandicus M.16.27]